MAEMNQVTAIIQNELSRLRRFAYSLTSNKADADDLVQNLAVKLLKTGIPADVKPIPWMLTICKNLWIDEIRSREVRMRPSINKKLADDEAYDSNDQSIHVDANRVLNAVADLPENHKLALSLVAIEGLSYAEAADVLEVPIGTIMSRVARARSTLAKQFEM